MSIVFIGLGSNMQQPRQQLLDARCALEQHPQIALLAVSSLYQSRAMMLPGSQPQADYINGVIKLQTELTPEALLDVLQAIENQQGRERNERWGARTLDLDILLFDDLSLQTERLILPHTGIAERNFVLYPLQQIAPDLRIPGLGQVSELAANVSSEGIELLGDFA